LNVGIFLGVCNISGVDSRVKPSDADELNHEHVTGVVYARISKVVLNETKEGRERT